MMRIITGKARGTKLLAPKGENTRPTAERTKEAVFSMLQFDVMGSHVLDLFAGSGQMGLEALSRGAAHATFCDASRDAIGVIRANAEKTRLLLLCDIFFTDYQNAIQGVLRGKQFDLVFLDPPYASGAVPKALKLLLERGLLRDGAKLVCETPSPEDVFGEDPTLSRSFETLRATRYGVAHVTVLQYRADEKGEKTE